MKTLKITLSLTTISLILLSPFCWAKIPDGHKDCSWGCKSIPPLKDSYLNFGEGQLETLPSKNLKILIWNIYKGKKPDFQEKYLPHVLNSDLALIQEYLTMKNVLETIINEKDHHMSVSFWMKRERKTGVMTISNEKVLEAHVQRTVDLEPFVKSPKTNMVTLHKLDNDKILLAINIHGINQTDTVTLERQIQQAQPFILKHEGPIIFAGDFNTRNEERQTMVDQFMNNLGMTKVLFPNEFRGRKKLDHTYIKGLKVVKAHLYPKNEGSDHPAMYVILNAE